MMISAEVEYTNWDLDRWIRDAGRGDREALRLLYRAVAPAVYAYALSILKNRFDAEDVLQDCFLKIQTGAEYKSQGKPMGWLMTVTRNQCLKKLRDQRNLIQLESTDMVTAGLSDPEDRLLIEACLQKLGDEERQIVILHAVAGFTFRQIGQHLGMKIPTAITKYRRAILKLKSML